MLEPFSGLGIDETRGKVCDLLMPYTLLTRLQ